MPAAGPDPAIRSSLIIAIYPVEDLEALHIIDERLVVNLHHEWVADGVAAPPRELAGTESQRKPIPLQILTCLSLIAKRAAPAKKAAPKKAGKAAKKAAPKRAKKTAAKKTAPKKKTAAKKGRGKK